jgi:hypothetical protein
MARGRPGSSLFARTTSAHGLLTTARRSVSYTSVTATPLPTEAAPVTRSQGVPRLYAGLRAVLGERLQEELRALYEDTTWYREELSEQQLFEFWVSDAIERAEDLAWPLQFLRVSERKFFFDALGIARTAISGLGTSELATLLLQDLGLPCKPLSGPGYYQASWSSLVTIVARGEDARAATLARQLSERLLRQLLFFYCTGPQQPLFLGLLREPGTLRLPARLRAIAHGHSISSERLRQVLAEDDWADLGFLAIALARVSSAAATSGDRHPRGYPLIVLDSAEQSAFISLAEALQAYAHDKPSRHGTRRQELSDALGGVCTAVDTLCRRHIIPQEGVVLAQGGDSIGGWFAVWDDVNGRRLYRPPLEYPEVGERVLVIAHSDRDSSRCQWTSSPWVALSIG